MSKEERFKSRVENLDFARLKNEVKILNELDVADKIRLVGIKKIDMTNAFTLAVEKVAEVKGEEAIPDSCSTLYNELHMDEESPLDASEEKAPPAPAKKAKAKAKEPEKAEGAEGEEKPKRTGPPKEPLDEYETRPGTLAWKFVQNVKANPQTMEEVRKADWNPRGYHFNETLKNLVEKLGKASVDKNGVITIK